MSHLIDYPGLITIVDAAKADEDVAYVSNRSLFVFMPTYCELHVSVASIYTIFTHVVGEAAVAMNEQILITL